MTVDARERWRVAVGVGFGIAFTALVSLWLVAGDRATVAPMGASAVLYQWPPTNLPIAAGTQLGAKIVAVDRQLWGSEIKASNFRSGVDSRHRAGAVESQLNLC